MFRAPLASRPPQRGAAPVRRAFRAASLTLTALLFSVPPGAGAQATDLARAEELIAAARLADAITLLDSVLKKAPRLGEALMLRSTAHFMNDHLERGRRDLVAALDAEPTLRQGWLNLGGLQMSQRDYPAALQSFSTAERLAPAAADNHLNLGAVLVLLGKLPEAAARFERYVAEAPARAPASYLVATNYALAGYTALAMSHLEQAVAGDERMRLQARTDQNFASLAGDERYQKLLVTDNYRIPSGHYHVRHDVALGYDPADGRLVGAVLDSLQQHRVNFDSRVEVAPRWALVWGDLRIKVAYRDERASTLEISAPPERFTPREWQQRTEALVQTIGQTLQVRALRERARS